MAVALQKARHDPNRWWKEIDDSLTTYDLCSIITHRIVAYVQLINAFWSNHGFQLNLANDPSVTFHLKRGTVYPSNHPLHLATAGASDSALMLALCALQMLVLLSSFVSLQYHTAADSLSSCNTT